MNGTIEEHARAGAAIGGDVAEALAVRGADAGIDERGEPEAPALSGDENGTRSSAEPSSALVTGERSGARASQIGAAEQPLLVGGQRPVGGVVLGMDREHRSDRSSAYSRARRSDTG